MNTKGVRRTTAWSNEHDRRQTLGTLMVCGAVAVPVMATCAIAFVLKLLT